MKLYGLKSKKGIYITDNNSKVGEYYSSSPTKLLNLFFDNKKPKETFHKDWVLVGTEPKKIEKEVPQPNINHRYELKDPDNFPNLQKVFKEEEVVLEEPNSSNGWEARFTEEFSKTYSLYEQKSDTQPNKKEKIDFELEIIGEAQEISESTPFSYRVYKTRWKHDGVDELTNKHITRNLFDEMATPSILHHEKPCMLTSKQTYDIIRLFVVENIDTKVAKITSDYDFCFTVKKLIEKAKPEKYTVDVNNSFLQKRRRKPRYETRYRAEREIEIFEMTYSPKCYDGYTPIKPFRGENEKDLNKNIDEYLNNLITKINEPIKDCSHCKGTGVILNTN